MSERPLQLKVADIMANSKLYGIFDADENPDGWGSDGRPYEHFRELIRIAEFTASPLLGRSCIDVGSGTGRFSAFWESQSGGGYLGVDIYRPSIEKARKTYPHSAFVYADILSSLVPKADYAFASGSLYTHLMTMDNYDFLQSMIERMLELSRIGIAFNFPVPGSDPESDALFFYDPEDIEMRCQALVGENLVMEQLRDGEDMFAHVWMWH